MIRRGGKHAEEKTDQQRKMDFSKQLIRDIRVLLWIVTVGVLALTFLCIFMGRTDDLPWLTVMVGLPWTAHGAVCSFYMELAKSDHREGGITFESAKAKDFSDDEQSGPAG